MIAVSSSKKGKRNTKGIDGVFAEAARIESAGRETIRAVFFSSWVDSDNETFNVGGLTTRDSGSSCVVQQTVRKLTIMQTKATDASIEHLNSPSAPGKVSLGDIYKYMQDDGPGEDASAPALSED